MFGERIHIARLESKMTLEQISEKIGISYQTYRKIEKGLNNPSFETMIKIAEMYNLSIDYLLGYTNEKKPLFAQK